MHVSADDQLICLHDLVVSRTSTVEGRAIDLTVAQLTRPDFGFRAETEQAPAGRELITLTELMSMVADARSAGIEVELAIETKHPNPRGAAVDIRVVELLRADGWDQADAPVVLISFSPSAVRRFAELLPEVLLIEGELGPWGEGTLPEEIRAVGVDVNLLRMDPDFVRRAHDHGHEVHGWTPNDPADIAFCRDLGVAGFTTDDPERVAEALLAAAPGYGR